MERKWTNGQPYERSRRLKRVIEMETKEYSQGIENDAYNTSLNHDENTWDILNQSLASQGFKVSSKREDLDMKISHRDMVQQRGFNPFLGENNYVNDISISDQFLKPINTSEGRVRFNE